MADEQASNNTTPPTPPTPPPAGSRRPVLKKRVGSKKRQDDVEQPDELVKVGGSVVDWVLVHGRAVGGAVAALLVVLLVWGIAQKLDRGSREEASAILFEAEKKLPGNDGLASRLGGLSLATASTPEEREAKTEEAVAALDEVIAEHGGTPQADVARLEAGGALYRVGKYEEALPYFTQATESNGTFGTLALGARAAALESLGRFDEAIADIEKLRSRTTGETRQQATIDLGRILEGKGDFERARQVYAEFEGEFPDADLLSEVQAKAAAIKGR